MNVVTRIADIKIPEANRHGEPFENTLKNWLGLMFIPTFKRVINANKKGSGIKL